MFAPLEKLLDKTTMYRVVLYVLMGLIAYAGALAAFSILPFSFSSLSLSLVVILGASCLAHYGCLLLTRAPGNIESTLITALILVLILTPPATLSAIAITALVSVLAIVLKYVVTRHLRHVFNPAALALVIAGVLGYTGVEWWVGSRAMLPLVLIGGIVIVMKTRRVPLVATYVVASAAILSVYFLELRSIPDSLMFHFLSWPTIFFATVMLTEPLGLPGSTRHQYAFAAIAATIGTIPFSFGPVHGTPELALLAANLYTFVVDAPARYVLTFVRKHEVGKGVVEYFFTSTPRFVHTPGEYLEWTLPHAAPDVRGIRRYFTIASAAGAEEVSFAIRHADKESSWKKELRALPVGGMLYATQRAGDFVLREGAPHHVWIAGGIGVTPFMSMVRSGKEPLSATLFYCNKSVEDIAFLEEVAAAHARGVATVHVLAEGEAPFPFEKGFVTRALIEAKVPEWHTATFYISGPPGLVASYRTLLAQMGVPRGRIVTDYFPGLA